jgi:enoyl-CoA hydratase/carnithine racemase
VSESGGEVLAFRRLTAWVIGGNPGGGGIELLSRLVGRSRALEIVLGADRLDADTAALYGCMCFLSVHIKTVRV